MDISQLEVVQVNWVECVSKLWNVYVLLELVSDRSAVLIAWSEEVREIDVNRLSPRMDFHDKVVLLFIDVTVVKRVINVEAHFDIDLEADDVVVASFSNCSHLELVVNLAFTCHSSCSQDRFQGCVEHQTIFLDLVLA